MLQWLYLERGAGDYSFSIVASRMSDVLPFPDSSNRTQWNGESVGFSGDGNSTVGHLQRKCNIRVAHSWGQVRLWSQASDLWKVVHLHPPSQLHCSFFSSPIGIGKERGEHCRKGNVENGVWVHWNALHHISNFTPFHFSIAGSGKQQRLHTNRILGVAFATSSQWALQWHSWGIWHQGEDKMFNTPYPHTSPTF